MPIFNKKSSRALKNFEFWKYTCNIMIFVSTSKDPYYYNSRFLCTFFLKLSYGFALSYERKKNIQELTWKLEIKKWHSVVEIVWKVHLQYFKFSREFFCLIFLKWNWIIHSTSMTMQFTFKGNMNFFKIFNFSIKKCY